MYLSEHDRQIQKPTLSTGAFIILQNRFRKLRHHALPTRYHVLQAAVIASTGMLYDSSRLFGLSKRSWVLPSPLLKYSSGKVLSTKQTHRKDAINPQTGLFRALFFKEASLPAVSNPWNASKWLAGFFHARGSGTARGCNTHPGGVCD